MINEQRRQEIMDKLKKERETRNQQIIEGNQEPYIDESLIQTPSIGQSIYQSEQQSYYESSSILSQQRDKLQEMKKKLYNKEHINRLAEPKTKLIEEREQVKQQIEDRKFNQLPFQPEISMQSNILAQLRYSKYQGIPIHERLQDLERERQEHIDDLKLALHNEEEQEQELKHQPKNAIQQPIHERYQQVMAEKKAYLEYLKAKQMKDEENLFKPKINAQSELIANIKNDGKTVVERLLEDARRKQDFIQVLNEPYDFEPQTNKEYNENVVKQQFDERQNEFLKKQMENISEIEKKVFAEYTFQPKIKSNMRCNSQDENVIKRLSVWNENKIQKIEEEQEKSQNQYNFYPELNPNSMKMAVERTLEDLIKNEYGELRKQQLKQKYEDKDKECSFYPSVSTTQRYSQMHSQYSFDDCAEKIKQYQTEKESKRNQAKKQQEEEILQQCTFKPQVNTKVLRNKSNIQVNGMETYMLKVDMARKQKDNKQLVEQKLFNKHEQYEAERHQRHTTPQCFNLSQQQCKTTYKRF